MRTSAAGLRNDKRSSSAPLVASAWPTPTFRLWPRGRRKETARAGHTLVRWHEGSLVAYLCVRDFDPRTRTAARSFAGQAACRDAIRRASSIASEPFRLHKRPPTPRAEGGPAEGGPGGRWTGAPSTDRDRAEAWAGDRRSCAKPTAMTTGRTGVVGTTPPPPPPRWRPRHRRLRDSDLDRAENPPVTSNPATLRRPSRSATPRPRGAGRPDPPPAVTGTRSDPDRDAHHCVLPRHRTAAALPAWRPARRVGRRTPSRSSTSWPYRRCTRQRFPRSHGRRRQAVRRRLLRRHQRCCRTRPTWDGYPRYRYR